MQQVGYDRSVEMQGFGGRLLSLPAPEVKQLAAVA